MANQISDHHIFGSFSGRAGDCAGKESRGSASGLYDALDMAKAIAEVQRQRSLLITGALQSTIFNSENFSSIATDNTAHKQAKNALPGQMEKQLDYFIAKLKQNLQKEQGITGIAVGPEKLKIACDRLEAQLAHDNAEADDVLAANVDLLSAAFSGHYCQLDESIRSFNSDTALTTLTAAIETSARTGETPFAVVQMRIHIHLRERHAYFNVRHMFAGCDFRMRGIPCEPA